MMVDVVDYAPDHLERIVLKNVHDGERPKEIFGNAVTILIGEVPIAILGWYFISSGVVQAWALISEEVKKAPKIFHKTVKSLIGFSFEKYSLKRMQFSVRCDYPAGWKWAKALGFECEGIMKQYGAGGANCWLLARVQYDRN